MLVFTVPMVRVYINSDVNGAGLLSMPLAMAEWVAGNVGAVWPFFAPMTGALGAFIAGSNTVSNLMFSAFQYGVAERLAMSTVMIVALQAVGAAAGNMVAIHNVVAASATVGLLGKEGSTLERRLLDLEGRVFAKTGTISNVNSLSGYLVRDDGREVVFSVLTNGSGLPSSRVRASIDDVVRGLAR